MLPAVASKTVEDVLFLGMDVRVERVSDTSMTPRLPDADLRKRSQGREEMARRLTTSSSFRLAESRKPTPDGMGIVPSGFDRAGGPVGRGSRGHTR